MKVYQKIRLIVIVLCIFGVVMVYSSSQIWAQYKMNNQFYFLIRQSIFFIVGIIVMHFSSKVEYSYYKKYANYIYFFCLFLLIIVLIPGIGLIRGGARSWIGIGQFSIQPSEFIKIALIIMFSKYLSKNHADVKKIKFLFLLGIFLIINFFLIMLQPDFGTAVVLLITISFLIFLAGIKMRYVAFVGVTVTILFVVMIFFSQYRMNRILAFLDPWEDPLGTGFQTIQSLYAISPNGLFGLGLFNSIQKFYYLPEPQTDISITINKNKFGLRKPFFIYKYPNYESISQDK